MIVVPVFSPTATYPVFLMPSNSLLGLTRVRKYPAISLPSNSKMAATEYGQLTRANLLSYSSTSRA